MSRYTVHAPWEREATFWPFAVEVAAMTDNVTGTVYRNGAYRVTDVRTDKPARRGKGGTVPFKGETAWSDADRLAQDLMFAARREGYPS